MKTKIIFISNQSSTSVRLLEIGYPSHDVQNVFECHLRFGVPIRDKQSKNTHNKLGLDYALFLQMAEMQTGR